MQMQCAERADCCRQSRRGWFHDLDPHAGQPANVQIPKVNGKTVARTIPVHKTFAELLHQWLSGNPLKGPMSQWPWEGQETQASTAMLFPGRARGGVDNRHWGVSVSRRAYYSKVAAAAEDILAERAEHRRNGKPHPFDESSSSSSSRSSSSSNAIGHRLGPPGAPSRNAVVIAVLRGPQVAMPQ